jgi:hypothetical protein
VGDVDYPLHPQGRCSFWHYRYRSGLPRRAEAPARYGSGSAIVNDLGPRQEVSIRLILPSFFESDGTTNGVS